MKKLIRTLIDELNVASDAYYKSGHEIMSNQEFDKKYEQLLQLEKETGIIFPDSPTQNVGSDITGKRKEITHEYPAKSLDKTKDISVLKKWLGNKIGVLSYKMDGQTLVLTYQDGNLKQAVTRGNGLVGEDVTEIASFIHGIPMKIDFKGKLVLRGESVMSYEEFERINDTIENPDEKYKNPRNLAVGTLNTLDKDRIGERKLCFKAFHLVYAEGRESISFARDLAWLDELGFETVYFTVLTSISLEEVMKLYEEDVETYEFPVDGLVLAHDDVKYGKTLGETGHHAKHSMAFKWADASVETKMVDIEWSPSKTGLLNPVAIFEPVEIEGTTVSRASVHNVSIFNHLKLGKGDSILVFKANMIIPQIEKNLTMSGTFEIPDKCPVCGADTKIHISTASGEEVHTLYCTNFDCKSKLLGKLEHFVSRDGMDMEGISEKTISLLYENGLLNCFSDFFKLYEHADVIKGFDKMGEVAVNNMLTTIEKSKHVELSKFIDALSIPMVGSDVSKRISEYCDGYSESFTDILNNPFQLLDISGIGNVVVSNIKEWYSHPDHKEEYERLLSILTFKRKEKTGTSLNDLTFVITGSVNHFPNRDAMKDFIISHGGKVAGSVSSKTNYLINNDVTSTSGKNKKAKELNIPIISEDDFLTMI